MIKKTFIICALFLAPLVGSAQGIKGKLNQLKPGGISQEEAGQGLKEALTKGIEKGVELVTQPDGYFGNAKIKIPFPEDAQNVEKKLRGMGMGKEVDNVILTVNRAAEDAAKEAKPIFVEAIKALTFQDALNILRGNQDAATRFLERTTSQNLAAKFKPIIAKSLEKVDATKHWETVINAYNKVPLVQKVNPDLEEYVTLKAIAGLFYMVEQEEIKIRQDPGARTSAVLKKVFAN